MSLYEAEAIAIPVVGGCLLFYAWVGLRLTRAMFNIFLWLLLWLIDRIPESVRYKITLFDNWELRWLKGQKKHLPPGVSLPPG